MRRANFILPLLFAVLVSGCAHEASVKAEDAEMLLSASRTESDGLAVIKLAGNPYTIGYQHGALLKDEIHTQWKAGMDFALAQFPVPLVNRLLIAWKLDSAYRKMAPFIAEAYKDEMRGLARGADISLKMVHRAHAIPDLYPTLCANGVYYGQAVKDSRLYHLRNLDWSRGMRVQERPALFVVRPEGKHAFVSAGYAGFIGVLTGINENGISVGQIGADTIDFTLKGEPMPFLIRRVLEDAESLNHAALMVQEAKRTYGYNYVFADALEKRAVALETTAHKFAAYVPDDLKEKSSGYGFTCRDVLVRSDTAFDPEIRSLQTASGGHPETPGAESPKGSAYETRYKHHLELANSKFGNLDIDDVFEIAASIAPGSNIQSVVFAYPDLWVANAIGENRAAEGPYLHFRLDELFGGPSSEKNIRSDGETKNE